MEEKRKECLWNTKFYLPFIVVCMLVLFIFSVLRFFLYFQVISNYRHAFDVSGIPYPWGLGALIGDLWFLCFNITLLIIMLILLRRTLGVLPRIEETSDKILKGYYSVRIAILKKEDAINSLLNKLNKVFDLIEKKMKG